MRFQIFEPEVEVDRDNLVFVVKVVIVVGMAVPISLLESFDRLLELPRQLFVVAGLARLDRACKQERLASLASLLLSEPFATRTTDLGHVVVRRDLERVPRQTRPARDPLALAPSAVRLVRQAPGQVVDEVGDQRRQVEVLVVLAREPDVGDEVESTRRDPRHDARVGSRLHVIDRDPVDPESRLVESLTRFSASFQLWPPPSTRRPPEERKGAAHHSRPSRVSEILLARPPDALRTVQAKEAVVDLPRDGLCRHEVVKEPLLAELANVCVED